MAKKFLLLNEIDEQINAENINWNENAFQTLVTSNLPPLTIVFYAIDVALRRLENSLYENYWDVTAEALHDLSQYIFNLPPIDEFRAYVYEAKCQLLLFASIALLKFHRVRHRLITDAKMCCTTIFFLLFEQSQIFEMNSNRGEYSSCICSMRSRFYKRIYLTAKWLPTLSDEQFRTIENHHEKYVNLLLEQLFPAKWIRDRIKDFIEYSLNQTESNIHEVISNDFVLIPRFPRFHRDRLDRYAGLMHIALTNTLQKLQQNPNRLFIYCLWTLCCSIEVDRLELGTLNNLLQREHFATTPIDFEEKPSATKSLHSCDLIVFLLLCAQQHVRTGTDESTLNPFLLYSSSNLSTKLQQKWWLAALQNSSSPEFLQQLAIIRLNEDSMKHFPPNLVLLRIALILFKTAKHHFEQYSHSLASSYEQYAIQYLQTVKKLIRDQNESKSTEDDRPFFFYPTMTIDQTELRTRIDECDHLARQCDELKSLPEPASPLPQSNLVKEEEDDDDDSSFVPVHIVPEQPPILENSATLPKIGPTYRDIDVQTTDSLLSPPIVETPPPPTPQLVQSAEVPTAAAPTFPPFVGMLFSHMNGVNQWINRHCITNQGIQNDIHSIRDRLEKLNRATSQMIYDNVKPIPFDSHQFDDTTNQ